MVDNGIEPDGFIKEPLSSNDCRVTISLVQAERLSRSDTFGRGSKTGRLGLAVSGLPLTKTAMLNRPSVVLCRQVVLTPHGGPHLTV